MNFRGLVPFVALLILVGCVRTSTCDSVIFEAKSPEGLRSALVIHQSSCGLSINATGTVVELRTRGSREVVFQVTLRTYMRVMWSGSGDLLIGYRVLKSEKTGEELSTVKYQTRGAQDVIIHYFQLPFERTPVSPWEKQIQALMNGPERP